MSFWPAFWLWMAGSVFVHGMLREAKPARRDGDQLMAVYAALVAWPYLLLSWLGALLGAAMVKAGVK